MNRISTITHDTANEDQKSLLGAIHAQLGMVPNFLGVLAHSTDALRAFLGLHGIADNGQLDPKTRERIALAMAQGNGCEYCLSAHTAIGKKTGLSGPEIDANRAGGSEDAKAAAAVAFASALNTHMGDITQVEFNAVRDAGYSDAEIVEIIVHVGMNILTNILGKTVQIDIDFPKVALEQQAA